jgi:hypothetical protein
MTTVLAETAVELLDRQHERLQAADGAEFVHELRRFYEFITAGPAPVAGALGELRAEAAAVEERFAEHDRELVPELVQLKEDRSLVYRTAASRSSSSTWPSAS